MSAHKGNSKFAPDLAWPTIVELAIELWGEPNSALSSRDNVRWGGKGARSVKPSADTWYDHETGEGGGYVDLCLKARGVLPERRSGNGHLPPLDDILATYPYRRADGSLCFEVVRTISGQPRFRQRRPLGGDRWKWSIKEAIPPADRPPYRLPELLAVPPGSMVFIAEGEKDELGIRLSGATGDDPVLDPFLGIGSTLSAAQRCGLSGIVRTRSGLLRGVQATPASGGGGARAAISDSTRWLRRSARRPIRSCRSRGSFSRCVRVSLQCKMSSAEQRVLGFCVRAVQ